MTVKERPILMSAPMIKALLSGSKTQTRRTIKRIENETDIASVHPTGDGSGWIGWGPKKVSAEATAKAYHTGGFKCPYSKPGDLLWVKENYTLESFTELMGVDDWSATVRYVADGENKVVYQCDAPSNVGFWPGAAIRKYEGKSRPCIFMYRWASRITLEITEVRVQRLQDISDEDCIAEGIGYVPQLGIMRACGWADYSGRTVGFLSAKDSYRTLWESINGTGSWEANPWVWAISFKRI